MDILGHLPVELALQVLGYLTREELFVCMQVSRRWKAVVNNEWLWSRMNHWHEYFPDEGDESDTEVDDGFCPAVRKFLTDRQTRKNWLYEDCTAKVVTELGVSTRQKPRKLGDCWLVDDRLLVTESGKELRFPADLPRYILEAWEDDTQFILSPNSLFLAVPSYLNFTYLLARPDRGSDFHLTALLGPASASRHEVEEESDAQMEIVNLMRRVGEQSLAEEESSTGKLLAYKRSDNGRQLVPHLFTGFDCPTSRRLILSHKSNNSLVFWDVHRCRVISYQKMEAKIENVKEGWERQGICVSFGDESVATYDLDGRQLQRILLGAFNWLLLDFTVMIHASVVVFKIMGHDRLRYRLVDWGKGRDEPRVFAGSARDVEYACGQASIAYYSCDKTITVLAAPDWVTVAVLHSFSLHRRQLHLFDFADGFALVVVLAMYRRQVENEFVIYEVDLSGEGKCEPECTAVGSGRTLTTSLSPKDVILSASSRQLLVFTDNKVVLRRFTKRISHMLF